MTILDPNIRKRLEDELDRNEGTLTIKAENDPAQLRILQEAEEMEREGLVKRAEEQRSPHSITYRRYEPTEIKPTVHDDSDR